MSFAKKPSIKKVGYMPWPSHWTVWIKYCKIRQQCLQENPC